MKEIERGAALYTQREDVPMEQRVFFRTAKGVNASADMFRKATADEYQAWRDWLKEQGDEEIDR